MIELYDDYTYNLGNGLMVYTRQTIDNRWPLYMKIAASEMLRDYGTIIMDDATGYPVDVDQITLNQIYNQL